MQKHIYLLFILFYLFNFKYIIIFKNWYILIKDINIYYI